MIMAIDNTPLFKACVKTVRARKKVLGEKETSNPNAIISRNRSDFISKASLLRKQITSLRDFILEHRKGYLNFTPSLVNTDQMTDEERDSIDTNAQKIIESSSHLASSLKLELKNFDTSTQAYEVNQSILDLIERYLKVICEFITQQMNTRVKWKSELQKLSKIESPSGTSAIKNKKSDVEVIKPVISQHDDLVNEDFDSTISEDELKVLEMENELLFNDVNSINEEVHLIQEKVVKIAEIQKLFTEKVYEQNKDLERVTNVLVGTTENIRDANEQVRLAIQNNAGFRFNILFFLLVMSLSLLFLDWYND